MIARLLETVGNSSNAAILLREAARTSRRWQTYAARTGFSGVLFAVLLLGVYGFMNAGADPADMGWMGRWIFIAFSTVMLLLATTLAPLITSAAIIEEIEDRTLEMLILSELTPAKILFGKVLSRILMLMTVVFGALPVLAMVVTLGGVAPFQVVAVVVHTLVAIVLMGVLGAFYGLFTRSPGLAMLASTTYAFVAFVLFPLGYTLLTAKPDHAAHFSLFAGPATTDWAALVSLLSYLPSLVVLSVIGTRLFELQVSNADLRHAFSADTWSTRQFFIGCGVACLGVFVVGPASMVLYATRVSQAASPLAQAVTIVSATLVWAWSAGVMALLSWVLLRVGVDVVDALDAILGGRDQRERERPDVAVWNNPVAWREARPAAWGANGLPLLVTWLLVLLGMLQMGWWMLPGGAVLMGVLNTLAALGLTVWLAARTVDQERRGDTFTVLLTTTLPSAQILLGKSLGVAVITLPVLLLSLPFFAFGIPYLEILDAYDAVDFGGTTFVSGFVIGCLTWLWTLPLWLLLLASSVLIAMSVKRSRSGFAVALGTLVTLLGVPMLLGRLFENTAWIAVPCRLIAPPLAGGASWWMYLVSCLGWSLAAAAVFGVSVRGLRRWILTAWALLLVVSLPLTPARAQSQQLQDGFLVVAEPLGGGIVRPGQWAPLRVRIENRGDATKATLRLDERSNTQTDGYERIVELPKGSRRELILLYRPGSSRARRNLVLTAGARRAVAPFALRPALPSDTTVGVLGTDLLGLQLLQNADGGSVPGIGTEQDDPRAVHAGLIEPGGLPRHAFAYQGFDQVVWPAADPTTLEPDQRAALLDWVALGGHLTLTVTDTASTFSAGPLLDALPLRVTGVTDRSDLAPLAQRWGSGPTVLPLATGDLASDAHVRVTTDDHLPVWSQRPHGRGTISVLTVDPRQLGLGTGERRAAFWRDVLQLPAPGGQLPDAWTAGYRHDGFPAELPNELRDLLNDIPGVAPLPITWLLAFSTLYLLAIGPVDWWILRRLGKQPLTWVTFPVTIVVFSSVALVGTTWQKGSQSVVTIVELIDVLPGGTTWHGRTHIGVFTTANTRVVLQAPLPNALVELEQESGYTADRVFDAGFGPGTAAWTQETWTLGYANTHWVAPTPGTLTLDRRGTHAFTVSNGFPFALRDVVIVVAGRTYPVPPLAPGATGSVDTARDTPVPFAIEVDESVVLYAQLDEVVHPPVLDGLSPTFKHETHLRIPFDAQASR